MLQRNTGQETVLSIEANGTYVEQHIVRGIVLKEEIRECRRGRKGERAKIILTLLILPSLSYLSLGRGPTSTPQTFSFS